MDRGIALVVDDDPARASKMSEWLAVRGLSSRALSRGVEARDALQAGDAGLLVCTLGESDPQGLELLWGASTLSPAPSVIALTPTLAVAERALAAGARAALLLPVEAAAALRHLGHAIRVPGAPASRSDRRVAEPSLDGRSPAILALEASSQRLRPLDVPVWISGPDGSGKLRLARSLHGDRAGRAVVFDGQSPPRRPWSKLLESARDGTLILRRPDLLSRDAQLELGRTLEEGIGRTGAPRLVTTSAVDAARHRRGAAPERGAPLPAWLAAVGLVLPPLRERPEDVLILVDAFIRAVNRAGAARIDGVAPDLLDRLARRTWAGEVRDLRDLVESMVARRGHGRLELADLPSSVAAEPGPRDGDQAARPEGLPLLPAEGMDLKTWLRDAERHFIRAALARTKGNRNRAARLLGMNRTTLVEKLRRLEREG
jgi:two-component system response regulator AtoC